MKRHNKIIAFTVTIHPLKGRREKLWNHYRELEKGGEGSCVTGSVTKE